MSSPQTITLSLDRRILEHPRAYHLRRMRAGIWLYLDLLARLPAGDPRVPETLLQLGAAWLEAGEAFSAFAKMAISTLSAAPETPRLVLLARKSLSPPA